MSFGKSEAIAALVGLVLGVAFAPGIRRIVMGARTSVEGAVNP